MSEAPTEEFWNERYRTGQTPWDYGGVPPEFADYLACHPDLGRLLVPGCGSGYEILAAIEAGNDAAGIELSSEAAERARASLGEHGDKAIAGDFFTYPFSDASFDAVYERTFLCAIPPELRRDYVRRTESLLKSDGVLFGFFLYGIEPEPPPYPLAEGEEKELFEPFFDLVESHPSRDPLPLFAGMERWQIWRKRSL